jgi:hypothetical protein
MSPLRISHAGLLAVVALGCPAYGSTASNKQESHKMSDVPQASRPAPPRVPPVEHKGVRYQQDMESARYGGGGLGGYLVAIDAKTGARLWMLKVYDVVDHSAAGVSSPGRYFRSMTLVARRDELAIEDEIGGRYAVDLMNRTVRILSEPKAAPTPPRKERPIPQ